MAISKVKSQEHISRPLVKSWKFNLLVKNEVTAWNISLYDNRRTVSKISLPSPQWAEFHTDIFCVVVMIGSKLKQAVSMHYKGTELDRNIGQIWTQHVWKVLDKLFVWTYWWIWFSKFSGCKFWDAFSFFHKWTTTKFLALGSCLNRQFYRGWNIKILRIVFSHVSVLANTGKIGNYLIKRF